MPWTPGSLRKLFQFSLWFAAKRMSLLVAWIGVFQSVSEYCVCAINSWKSIQVSLSDICLLPIIDSTLPIIFLPSFIRISISPSIFPCLVNELNSYICQDIRILSSFRRWHRNLYCPENHTSSSREVILRQLSMNRIISHENITHPCIKPCVISNQSNSFPFPSQKKGWSTSARFC